MATLTTIDSAMTESDFDALPEFATPTPLAYRLALPISDPVDPEIIPRMGTHGTTTVHTSCDSAEWCTSFHDA